MSRHQNEVPILIGSNAEEARALVNVSTVKASSFIADIEASFGALPPPLYDAYPHATDKEARVARLDIERDLRFGWDMWAWARLQATFSQKGVYYDCFEQRPPFPAESIYAGWGASHYAELWYVFDHLDQNQWKWTPADRSLAHAISTYWANFVRDGNPNGSGLRTWPVFVPATGTVMHLRAPVVGIGPVLNESGLAVFDAVYNSVRESSFGQPK